MIFLNSFTDADHSVIQHGKEKGSYKSTISQIIPVMVKNVLLIAFGATLGYPTILIPSLSTPHNNKEGIILNQEQISWIGSLNMLSLPFGCCLSGIISQAIGRKFAMQASSLLVATSWVLLTFSNDIWHIYVLLIIMGLAAGLLESPVLTYVAEITEPHIRGSLLSTGPLSSTLGTFLEFLLGSAFHWRTVSAYSAVFPLTGFVLLFFVPESPTWLIMKNRMPEARKSLSWVRGWSSIEAIEDEFQNIVASCSERMDPTKRNKFKLDDFKKRGFIHPFLLICYIFVLYNFSGLTTIPVYVVKMFETLKVPIDQYDATVIYGFAQFLGCLTCVLIIPYTGKRLLAFFAIIIAAASVIIVGTYAHLNNINYLYINNEIADGVLLEYSWIPLVFIPLTAFMLNCGLRTQPWTLVAEAFPPQTRAVATGGLGGIAYTLAFGSSKSFLETVGAITLPGLLWCYGLIGLMSVIMLYFWLPETEGKSLQEITDHFAGNSKLGNKIRRRENVAGEKN